MRFDQRSSGALLISDITFTNTPNSGSVPNPTPTACVPQYNYLVSRSPGSIVPGNFDVGLHCDGPGCVTNIGLPFSYTLYDRSFNSVNATENGTLSFTNNANPDDNSCLPSATLQYAIFPYWDNLYTNTSTSCPGCGVYTSMSGQAPNRIFNIEWRACEYNPTAGKQPPYASASCSDVGDVLVDFEARLYEGQTHFDVVIQDAPYNGYGATIGVQADPSTSNLYTQYNCNTQVPNGVQGVQLSFTLPPRCNTPTLQPTNTTKPTKTPTPTNTNTPTYTNTPTATYTACPLTPTPVPGSTCNLHFQDAQPGSPFYPFIQCLACRGVLSGYPCGGPNEECACNQDPYFRPGADVTRGQIAKIVSNSAGFTEDPGSQIYQDVPPGSTFYNFINRLSRRNVVSGYPCGGVNPETGAPEPCVLPGSRNYFRPSVKSTRGQVSQIVSNSAGFTEDPGAQIYQDVPPGSTFYYFINRLTNRHIMGGYPCGGTNPQSGDAEPCVEPGRLGYFRPGNYASRGQTAKIVANTFPANCRLPSGLAPQVPQTPQVPGAIPTVPVPPIPTAPQAPQVPAPVPSSQATVCASGVTTFYPYYADAPSINDGYGMYNSPDANGCMPLNVSPVWYSPAFDDAVFAEGTYTSNVQVYTCASYYRPDHVTYRLEYTDLDGTNPVQIGVDVSRTYNVPRFYQGCLTVNSSVTFSQALGQLHLVNKRLRVSVMGYAPGTSVSIGNDTYLTVPPYTWCAAAGAGTPVPPTPNASNASCGSLSAANKAQPTATSPTVR